MTCTVSGCEKKAAKGGVCWMHIKRRQRGKALEDEARTYKPWDTLLAAVRAYFASDNDDDFARHNRSRSRIEKRVEKAAVRYADSLRRKRQSSAEHCPPPLKE